MPNIHFLQMANVIWLKSLKNSKHKKTKKITRAIQPKKAQFNTLVGFNSKLQLNQFSNELFCGQNGGVGQKMMV